MDTKPAPASTNSFFLDLFRRADKNDDGSLSREEFQWYFGGENSGLGEDECNILFDLVDADKSGNISVEELCDYFGKGFEAFTPLFEGMGTVNKAVSVALQSTAETYGQLPNFEQFKVRFFLTEFLSQLRSLYTPVDKALDHLKALKPQETQQSSSTLKPPQTRALASSARTQRMNQQRRAEVERAGIEEQVNRLASIVDKLAITKLKVSSSTQPLAGDDDVCVIVSREHTVLEDQLDDFSELTANYIKKVAKADGLQHQYAKKTTKNTFTIYEVWASDEHLKKHYRSPLFQNYAKNVPIFLEEPVITQSMHLPSEWFEESDDGSN